MQCKQSLGAARAALRVAYNTMASDDSSSSSSSDDEKKRKREKKESKKRKKKEKKEKKKSKKHKRSRSEDAPAPARGPAVAVAADDRIDDDDFFVKSEEFRVWLHESKRVYLDDLATDDARDRFRAFVGAWNDGRLDRMYYDGIPSNVRDRCKRTRHAWNFKLSDEERWNLASTKDSIDGQTRRANPAAIRQLPTAAPMPGAGAAAPRQRLMLSQRDAAETDRLAEQIRAQTGGSRLQIAPRKD